MPKQTLTQTFVDSVVCESNKSKIDYFDTKLNGLLLKVLPSGKKNYYLRFKNERGVVVEKRLSNMDASVIKLAEARTMAQTILSQIAVGDNPFEAIAELKRVPTIESFIMDSYLPFVKGYKRSWNTDWSLIKNHILPAFGDKHMDELTKRDVIAFIGRYRATHAAASVNRILILLRYIFNCATRWDTVGVKSNPTTGIPLLEENNKNERYLSQDEAKRLFEAVQRSDNKMMQYIIPMLILTGTRKREVLDAKWSEFDFERRIWRIGMSKSGKARHVPMSDGVIKLLQSVPRIEDCEWVFANPKTKLPFDNVFCSWDTARKRAGLADVRIHDLRHSFASFLVNGGRSLYEVQKILGHTQIKTTQRYAHLANDTLLDAANQVSKLVPLANVMPNQIESVPLVNVLAA
ncbi:MAG TPA: tyrosine-type recombinase/integrase [Thiotrichales bacterium]|nr:tyrosine-type recombinase/integrase [Thiotrichales bacterium]